jgi:hypothetical protein
MTALPLASPTERRWAKREKTVQRVQEQIAEPTRQFKAAVPEAKRALQAKEDELNRMTASIDQTISEILSNVNDRGMNEGSA